MLTTVVNYLLTAVLIAAVKFDWGAIKTLSTMKFSSILICQNIDLEKWLEAVRIWKKICSLSKLRTWSENLCFFSRWKEDIFADNNKEFIDYRNNFKSTHGKHQDYFFFYSICCHEIRKSRRKMNENWKHFWSTFFYDNRPWFQH